MSNPVHAVAQSGFGSGTNDLYDRARPSYQSFALSYIRKAVSAASSLNVVEIGAGTGIFTRALLAHPEWSDIVALKAVEPSDGMRSFFAKSIQDSRVTVSKGTFDLTGIDDGWADLVVIAQAFHWCPDYDTACTEFARILKPTGIVALIWNLEDREAASWVAALRDRIEQHEGNTPQFRLNLWRQAFDCTSYKRLFREPLEKVWPYTLPATTGIVVDRACSKSYIAMLPEDQRARVSADVRNIVEDAEDKVWEDQEKCIFKYPYKCYVMIARRQ